MYINKESILNSKKPKIDALRESFNQLKANDTPANRILFMNEFRNQPTNVIKENLSYMYTIPSQGTSFMNHIIRTSYDNVNELQVQKESLVTFIKTLKESNYVDGDHIKELENTVDIIDDTIEQKNDVKNIKDEVQMEFYINRANSGCLFESYLVDEMEILIHNINYNPETITDYELLLRRIKTSHTTEYLSSFPKLIEKSTQMLVALEIPMSGTPAQVLTDMPITIAEKIIELKVSKSQAKAYINIMNKQITTMYKELKDGDNRKYVIYRDYMDKIRRASDMLGKYCGIVKEGVAEMQPDIIQYDEAVVEDIVAEIEDTITNMVFDEDDEFDDTVIESIVNLYNKTM